MLDKKYVAGFQDVPSKTFMKVVWRTHRHRRMK